MVPNAVSPSVVCSMCCTGMRSDAADVAGRAAPSEPRPRRYRAPPARDVSTGRALSVHERIGSQLLLAAPLLYRYRNLFNIVIEHNHCQIKGIRAKVLLQFTIYRCRYVEYRTYLEQ